LTFLLDFSKSNHYISPLSRTIAGVSLLGILIVAAPLLLSLWATILLLVGLLLVTAIGVAGI
jgi:hypothetical protein